MFVRIANQPRPYAWGSTTGIAEVLGTEPGGGPEAELWLGAHPAGPSVTVPDGEPLDRWLAERAGAAAPRFLMKVLAAAAPLSLQAHPTEEQAREGFAREEALGRERDDPTRNYRDPHAKPELIWALSERFDALSGFRELGRTRAIVEALARAAAEDDAPPLRSLAARLRGEGALRETVSWLLTDRAQHAGLVAALERTARAAESAGSLVAEVAGAPAFDALDQVRTVPELAAHYPGDPGVVVALLLNRVSLARGEALYLAAGNVHAYLSGVGIELMGPSDNVLRGGLTPKHIDVAELLRVVDFSELPPPLLPVEPAAPGALTAHPPGFGFRLTRYEVTPGAEARLEWSESAILLAVRGRVSIDLPGGAESLSRGEAAYLAAGSEQSGQRVQRGQSAQSAESVPIEGGAAGDSAAAGVAVLSGDGELFVATHADPGARP